MRHLLSNAIYAVATTCLTVAFAGNGQAAGYFKDKTLTLWVGGGVAGGINAYGRTIGRHITRYLPGNPSFVARNLPGAGGVGAAISLNKRGKRDGTHFGTWAQGAITDPVMRPKKKFNYDMQKFVWIGSLNSSVQSCYVRSDSGINNVQDARDRKVKMAGTGARSASTQRTMILNTVIGTRFVPILGYRGSGGAHLAMERGEVAGRCSSYDGVKSGQPDWLKTKFVRFLFQLGFEKHPDLPNVPDVRKFVVNKNGHKLLDFLTQPLAIANAFALPLGTDPARVKEWRAAWNATVNDPKFRAEAAKRRLQLKPRSGDEVAKIIKQIYATSPEIVKLAAKALRAEKGRCNPKVSKKCRGKRKKKKKSS
jgi:tripartite-type tricarboxylate transporter receptor subunit TctC